ETSQFSSRMDLIDDPYWADEDDAVLSVFQEQVQVARARAYGPNYLEMSTAVQEALQAAISGESSVKDALDRAAEVITPLLPE
ncbi:MAG TPA: hypothetical protein VJZ27_19290, partial [Aggregatilineales bacterium]|nr:hypothetical protein [Aggregatilineales bacterium]